MPIQETSHACNQPSIKITANDHHCDTDGLSIDIITDNIQHPPAAKRADPKPFVRASRTRSAPGPSFLETPDITPLSFALFVDDPFDGILEELSQLTKCQSSSFGRIDALGLFLNEP